jgi:hypothetical protein
MRRAQWKESNGVFTVSGGEASECPADKVSKWNVLGSISVASGDETSELVQDFFPDKAIVTDAMFEISYHKTYKVCLTIALTSYRLASQHNVR